MLWNIFKPRTRLNQQLINKGHTNVYELAAEEAGYMLLEGPSHGSSGCTLGWKGSVVHM